MSLSIKNTVVPHQIASVETSQRLGIFACGSYKLCEDDGRRTGQIFIHNSRGVLVAQSAEIAGVLDMKWGKGRTNSLVTALSDGTLGVYDTPEDFSSSGELAFSDSILIPEEGLFLSVDVSPAAAVVSTQSGSILAFALDGEGVRLVSAKKEAHRMLGENVPAWIVAMNPSNDRLLCSGGDDAAIRLWDLRCFEAATCTTSKAHDAGVTSAAFSPADENLLAVGSYDERLHIWDMRNMKDPLTRIDAGGGVWRIRFHPLDCSIILAACMHNGTAVYKLNGADIDARFTAADDVILSGSMMLHHPAVHSSNILTYGADWAPGITYALNRSFITSSFYERYFDIADYYGTANL